MRGLSKIKALVLIVGTGASLAIIPLTPASAGTINNPLTVAGTVRCKFGSAESLKITGGGEAHGAAVGSSGNFSVFFANPQLPSPAIAEVRCDVGGTRTFRSTNFPLHRPVTGQTLVVNLVA
ncbi:hypothetical protein [Candidatus Frankia alpina]|uniref:Uncharacterized protein n=2 Tax=Candidatus Frankia alpina TaxID=2699483 RepID=A0A4S5C2L5_9ACTN|nr:hypothetical protein [Candidatus Frankia alpina]THJ38021.1 hypothetical protein E7Y31_20870 [Candidatus Frankia alpina]